MSFTKDQYGVETIEDTELYQTKTNADVATVGTVKLTDGAIVFIPTPSSDPRDPLNMALWQKFVFLVVISLCRFSIMDTKSSNANTINQSHAWACP